MLNIIKLSKGKYNTLSPSERNKPETVYLCKDATTGLCSFYIGGECYGEDIDEGSINNRIKDIEKNFSEIQIANNSDILNILNS